MKFSDRIKVPRGTSPRGGLVALALIALAASPLVAEAKPGARNLGAGLERLAAPASRARSLAPGQAVAQGDAPSNLEVKSPVIQDAAGRALVRITLNGKVPAASVVQKLKGMAGVEVTATDMSYRMGVVEAFVAPGALMQVANDAGVLAVVPSSPVITNVGLVDSQGVVQHRVDQIAGVDGSGITIGVMSDSFDTRVGAITTATDDVASGDLPGPGNPNGYEEPVVVLEDVPNGSDEGRAMAQIVHDMAPGARLGFATAFGGEVGFANNIRALAGFPDAPNAVPNFKADVIVDDVIYLAEPFFQDGIIARAVDEVAAAGVSYFSSAGNRPATQAYDSRVRIVAAPADPATLSKTPLDFSGVDPALYAGGFHDFDETAAVDIAQTVQINNGTISFQWNEPFDPQPPTPIRTLAEGFSTVSPATGFDTFTFDATAGILVEIFLDADDRTTGIPNPDLTFALFDPNGDQVTFVDTGTNPESLALELPATGTYTVLVQGFQGATGDYLYRVQEVEVVEQVLSDYNLLFFFGGNFLFAANEQNQFTNRPIELLNIGTGGGTFNLEMVISRANTPSDRRNAADRIRYVWFGTGIPQEYFSYLGPVTFGHNSAEGAMGVAAYAFYAPFVPEAFTSPGPATIYFDTDNRRYRHPQIRQKPDLAAMDGANNTFFGGDSSVDPDTFPNFFGTSAAAPHAAAVAALVLDAAGGPGSVSPNKMRKVLQDSAFPHDLDPYFSSGFAWSRLNFVAVSASADPNAISQFDPSVFSVWNLGRKGLASISFNGTGGNPTQTPTGVVFDERVGPGQPFVIGKTFGLDPADVTAAFSMPADPPGVAGQWKQLDLAFRPGSFGRGNLLAFGVDRDEADSAGPSAAVGGNSADLLGGGVLIPEGKFVPGGARFFGSFEDGRSFSGEFWNLIGRGYSQLDGYGFINAEAAVNAVSKKKKKK